VKLNEVKYLEQVKRIPLTLLLVALSRKASRILRLPYLRLPSHKAVLYIASTQGSPFFPPSAFQLIDMDTSTVVPTVPLSRISFAKLLAKDKGETERLFQACKNLGFFSLDLRSHPEGTQLLGVSDRLLALGEPLFDLPPKELLQYRMSGKSMYGYVISLAFVFDVIHCGDIECSGHIVTGCILYMSTAYGVLDVGLR